jgi:acetolactate synthase-1/2/3 large subunit
METAAEVFVRCLENEGVRHVFGIPGEETLDLNEAAPSWPTPTDG